MARSIDISEIQVLPIGQILECSLVEIPSGTTFTITTTTKAAIILTPSSNINTLQAISPFILPSEQEPKETDDHDFQQVRHNHGPNAQRIRGALVRAVEEGACDISRAVAKEQDGVGDDFLRMARRVGDLQGQYKHECRIIGPREQVADVAAYAVGLRYEA